MPALVKRRVGSLPGTSELEGTITWPRARRIHQGIRHPVPAELGGDADRALSALRVPVDVVFRETPVVDDTARSEPGDHLLRGGRLKTLRAQLRVQLRPREIAPGEQC